MHFAGNYLHWILIKFQHHFFFFLFFCGQYNSFDWKRPCNLTSLYPIIHVMENVELLYYQKSCSLNRLLQEARLLSDSDRCAWCDFQYLCMITSTKLILISKGQNPSSLSLSLFQGRMALLVTLFLVLVNIFNAITNNSPKADGLNALQVRKWMPTFNFSKLLVLIPLHHTRF